MARQSRAAETGLIAITIEGGLIAPEQVQKIVRAEGSAKVAESYACPKGTSLAEEISRYFRIGQAIWRDYDKAESKTIARTAAFVRELLGQCFGFPDLAGPVDHVDGTRRYRIALEAKSGRVPVVVAAPIAGADAFAKSLPEFGDGEGGRPKRSPAALLQDWLNANPGFYWGLVFAGDRVRLMRDNASLTRPAWIEADMGAIFRDEMFADFTAFWLLAHATRFGAEGAAASDCALEQWREEGMKQGVEARKDLYANVATALEELGRGLVEANLELREQLQAGTLSMQALFEELLRTVYRLIFLAVAEDRDLLHPRRTPIAARQLYSEGYSFSFWRERSRRQVARDGHHDAWEAVKVTFAHLQHGEDLLGLPALGGLFAVASTPNLNAAKIPNRRFLAALFCLGFIKKDGVTHRINWRDLKTEELGSVYEGLLEIRPSLTAAGEFQLGTGAKGNDRKTSGSYYTPDSLVECLLDSALNSVLERAEASGATPEEKVAAILDLKVIDPACGSGHFLLGAARRMADRVARLRNEDAGKEETQAALRDVVSRCIHGVDRNPMAVELAKVALWIESVSPGQPLGFLDANIRCGDALLGVFDLAVLEEGIPDEAYKPLTGDDKDAAKFYLKLNRDAKQGQGRLDFAGGGGLMPARPIAAGLGRIKTMPEDTVGQVEKKRQAFEAWKADPARYATEVACDLYMAAFLMPKTEVPLNYQRAMVPTTGDVRQRLAGGNVYGPLEGAARDVAGAASVLHWPLEFPDVMVGKGGFDVVLGNPPWERIKLQEQEFFAGHPVAEEPNAAARTRAIARLAEAPEGSSDRRLYESFQIAKRVADSSSVFARVSQESGGRYPYTGSGDINTYALFSELCSNLAKESGCVSLIVPSGLVTDLGTSRFFSNAMRNDKVRQVIGFENEEFLFEEVHNATKFLIIVLRPRFAGEEEASFRFLLRRPSQALDERREFNLNEDDLRLLNPNSATAPIFRSKMDAQITKSLFRRFPVLWPDDESNNPWDIRFLRMFDMANDSSQFLTKADMFNLPKEEQDLCVPLYEGKMFHFYNHRHGSYHNFIPKPGKMVKELPLPEPSELSDPTFEIEPRYWIKKSIQEDRVRGSGWNQGWFLVWRDVTGSTVFRTMISTVIPDVAIGHKAPIIMSGLHPNYSAILVSCFSSLTFDFLMRQKLGGTSLTYSYLRQVPIPPPEAYASEDIAFIVPRVLELTYTSHSMAPFARDLGYEGPPFAWDEDRRAQLRAELDAWYALAYGLTRDELRYVLDPKDVMGEDYPSETFRVLQKNEIARHGEYRTRRLVLAAYDELIAQGMRPRTEGWR